ncbi:hypothetical protein C5167_025443, partial [Papaver somniferum]
MLLALGLLLTEQTSSNCYPPNRNKVRDPGKEIRKETKKIFATLPATAFHWGSLIWVLPKLNWVTDETWEDRSAQYILLDSSQLSAKWDPARAEANPITPRNYPNVRRPAGGGAVAEVKGGGGTIMARPQQQHSSYAHVANLLKCEGLHIEGIVNPTQLARWKKEEEELSSINLCCKIHLCFAGVSLFEGVGDGIKLQKQVKK